MSLVHILILTGCIIVVNGQYGGRPGRPTHRPPTLPPWCATVRCARPDCPNPNKPPPGQCCPVCPTVPPHCAAVLCVRPECPNPTTPPGQCCPVCQEKTCFYKGVKHQDGETFKDDCNTCTCNNGIVGCTKIGCISKPGQCPNRPGPGICVSLCTGDSSCPGKQKCCSNGCGHQCMSPVGGGRPCYHEGEMKKDGEKFKDSCNTCTCNDGHISCTEKACGSKPGRCPRRPRGWGLCIDLCTDDSTCLGSRKCCSTGCGHTCQLPVGGGRCDGITCPQLRCANQYTLPGRCCPICKPIGKPDCRNVACTMEYCENQYTPPGQCCPVCPPNTY